MGAFTLYLADVTEQAGRLDNYNEQEIRTYIAQHDGRRGPMDAQMMTGVGFASVPVEGDRLIVMQKDGNLYAIAGASQLAEEALNLSPGERALFATDATGALAAVLKMLAAGATLSGTLDVSDTTTIGGTGAEPAALADTIDKYFAIIDSMLTAVDPLVGNIYANLKSTAFPPSGVIPSVAATKLNTK